METRVARLEKLVSTLSIRIDELVGVRLDVSNRGARKEEKNTTWVDRTKLTDEQNANIDKYSTMTNSQDDILERMRKAHEQYDALGQQQATCTPITSAANT